MDWQIYYKSGRKAVDKDFDTKQKAQNWATKNLKSPYYIKKVKLNVYIIYWKSKTQYGGTDIVAKDKKEAIKRFWDWKKRIIPKTSRIVEIKIRLNKGCRRV